MVAVDSSALFDVLIEDPTYAKASEAAIAGALAGSDVVVCDAVIAEVQAMLDTTVNVMEALETFGIRHEPGSEQAAVRAGLMFKRYRARGGKRERVVADFLIGAHALLQCSALITRDDGFFRDYFKGLKVIVPKVA